MALVLPTNTPREGEDWRTFLDSLPIQQVEETLQRTRLDDSQHLSVLEFLQTPGGGRTRADALKEVLEVLGDRSEDIAVIVSLVWRYAEANELWTTHPNPRMRSAEAFLNNLTNNQTVKLNIVFGTSTSRSRRGSIRIIEREWGTDWFERIPPSIRPPIKSPYEAPKRLLIEIAANCKQGVAFDEAVASWEGAVRARTDEDIRNRTGSRARRDRFVTSTDVAQLNRSTRPSEIGRRPVEMFIPELQEDRIELKGLQATQQPPADTAQQSREAHTRPPKRRRIRRDEALPDDPSPATPMDHPDDVPPQSAQRPPMPRCYSSLVVWHVRQLQQLDDDRRYACCDGCEDAVGEILRRLHEDGVEQALEDMLAQETHNIDDETIELVQPPDST